jgi:aldose 1-epimerase
MLINSPDGIPTAEVPVLSGERQLAEAEGMDNFLLDESGHVSLRLGHVRCEMDARGAEGFHVYVPAGENFFCVEPVSHPPNAFAKNSERYALAPSATRRLHMRLSVVSDVEETRG